jgi:hypothetical protein
LIADTGYELYAACETVRDLDQLYSDLGMADETPDDVMHSVCDPPLPEAGKFGMGLLRIWTSGGRNWQRLCSKPMARQVCGCSKSKKSNHCHRCQCHIRLLND